MPLPARLASLWRDLFQKARVDSEIDEEVRAYARMLEEEKLGSGMTAEEARRAAAIEVGGVEQVKERVRDARLGTFLGTVVSDLRYGLRALAKNPGFAAAAVDRARARHRRHGRDLQRRQRGAAEALPLPGSRPARRPPSPARQSRRARELPRLAKAGDVLRADGRGGQLGPQSRRLRGTLRSPEPPGGRRAAGERAGGPGDVGHPSDAGSPAAARARLPAGRGRARQGTRGRPEPPPVAAPLRRRPEDPRAVHRLERRAPHGRRGDAEGLRLSAVLGDGDGALGAERPRPPRRQPRRAEPPRVRTFEARRSARDRAGRDRGRSPPAWKSSSRAPTAT